MAKKNPLRGLLVRSGAVRRPDLGFLLAGDPKQEAEEIPHAITFRWQAGAFYQGSAKFGAFSICIIDDPEYGVVHVSGPGIYSVETRKGMTTGNIFNDSQPKPKEPRYGDITAVAEIQQKAYAVGLEGMVYRLDALKRWTRMDDGLPQSFDIQAIHGFSASDIYAAGRRGELWHYSGRKWTKRDLPTNVTLTTVKCAGDGKVYIGGHEGILIRGRTDAWETIEHEGTEDDIWDLEWFKGSLYVSTMTSVYRLNGDALEEVDFGKNAPKTCYHLSAAEGVLWSIGEKDVMSFDGADWQRIV